MKTNKIYFITVCLISVTIASCQTPKDNNVLAKQGNYSLTKSHLEKHLADLESALGQLSKEEIRSEKSILIEMFKEAPEETLASLKEDVAITPSPIPEPHYNNTSLALGHLKVRQVLGSDIGQMQFNSQAANQFRAFMANTLLTSGSSSGGDIGRGSETKIQFCANGTYSEYRAAYLIGEVPGMDVGGTDEDTIPGYWEVASLPNNMMLVLLYSTHPNMMEYSTNGFLPMVVERYTQQVVYLPGGEYYKRFPNQCIK